MFPLSGKSTFALHCHQQSNNKVTALVNERQLMWSMTSTSAVLIVVSSDRQYCAAGHSDQAISKRDVCGLSTWRS